MLDRIEGGARRREAFASYRHSQYTRLQRSRGGLLGSADAHLNSLERMDLVERARDLERNNAIARGMLDRSVDNIVSTGIVPQARTGDEGLDAELEAAFAEEAEHIGIRGEPFWMLQRLALRSVQRDGDIGFNLAGKYLQPIETERICSPYDFVSNTNIVQGIEMDRKGRIKQYWVANYYPSGTGVDKSSATPIIAERFIHLYNPERISQTRGCPAWASCLGYFEQLDQYIEAELVSAQVSACLTAYFVGEDHLDLNTTFGEDVENESGDEQKVIDMEPGLLYNLTGLGKGKIEVVNPQKPPRQFPDFVTAMLRFLGMPLGLPLELVGLDYQKGSYSSGRLALLQAHRTFRVWQQVLIDQFCKRTWRWKIGQIIDEEKIQPPKKSGINVFRHTWQAPGWQWIDPIAEAKANALAIDRCMKTLQGVARQGGADAKDLMRQQAEIIAQAKQLAEEFKIDDYREIIRADWKPAKPAQG